MKIIKGLAALAITAVITVAGVSTAQPAFASHGIAPLSQMTCNAGQAVHIIISTSGRGTVTANWGSGNHNFNAGGTTTINTGLRSVPSIQVTPAATATILSVAAQCRGVQTPPNCAPGGMCAVSVPIDESDR